MILPLWFTLVSTTGTPDFKPAFSAVVAVESEIKGSKSQRLRQRNKRKRK